jgi:cytoskeletal protein RodZ
MEEHRVFGRYLRAERELRQISLAEISSGTKIPVRTLQCLEEGSWGSLPAEVFLRGFVRSYARYVGLPVDEAGARFDTTMARIHAAQDVADTEAVGDAAAEVGGRRRFGLALFVIILLIIATITLSLIWRRGASANTHASRDVPFFHGASEMRAGWSGFRSS